MSRSNPTDNTPNPSTRWHEWHGAEGHPKYYDREAKKNIDLAADFTFILLDQCGTVKGWHEPSESGIYANEVKDTRSEPMLVRAFKGGKIAEGIYSQIKDRVAAAGGHFVANCYIGFKDETKELVIGSFQFKGVALSAWFEFVKKHRKEIYTKAIRIKGFVEGKKGKVTFRSPQFFLVDINEATEKAAMALDVQLQEYLKGYFARTSIDKVAPADDSPQTPQAAAENEEADASQAEPAGPPMDDDQVPF